MLLSPGMRRGRSGGASKKLLLECPLLLVCLIAICLPLTTRASRLPSSTTRYRHRALLLTHLHAIRDDTPEAKRRSHDPSPSPLPIPVADESQKAGGLSDVEIFVSYTLTTADPALAELYEKSRASLGSLFQKRSIDGHEYVFTSTGDIPAMWIRDSTGEAAVYFRDLAANAAHLASATGLLRAHVLCLSVDQYANACRLDFAPRAGKSTVDIIFGHSGWVFTDNFELDSLAYFFRLARHVFDATPSPADRAAVFDARFWSVVRKLLALLRREQNHETLSSYEYPGVLGVSATYPELAREGRGRPVNYTGMVWSGFRASDEPQIFGYHVPANMMLVVELRSLASLAEAFARDVARGDDHGAGKVSVGVRDLAAVVDAGIRNHALVTTDKFGPVWAYEVDGLGNALLIDDANVPSLLSIPVIGYAPASDPVFVNTRRMILTRSADVGRDAAACMLASTCARTSGNPYFYESAARNNRGDGPLIAGVGSTHTWQGYVWPMALITQARSLDPSLASDKAEITALLDMVKRGAIVSGLPESFNVDVPAAHTRELFGWVDALLMELLEWLVIDTAYFLPPPPPPRPAATPTLDTHGAALPQKLQSGSGATQAENSEVTAPASTLASSGHRASTPQPTGVGGVAAPAPVKVDDGRIPDDEPIEDPAGPWAMRGFRGR